MADHLKDWDLFTDALKYAYNSQVHRVTKVAPFEPVLSRPPPPLAIQAQPAIDPLATNAHTHTKWRECLGKLIGTARAEMAKGQLRYKSDFHKKIRIPMPNNPPGSYVFIRKEYFNPKKDKKHKLATIATGPYEVIEVNQDTVVIKDDDLQHERISRDRVVMAPPPRGARNSPDTVQGGGTGPTTRKTSQQGTHIPAMHASPAIQLDDLPPPPSEGVINGLPDLENYFETEGSAASPDNDDVGDLTIPPPGHANPATEPTTLTEKVQFFIPRDPRPADDNQTIPASGNDTTDKTVSQIPNTGPLPPSRLREGREEPPGGEEARPTTQSGTTSNRSDLLRTLDGDISPLENRNQQGSPLRQKASTTSASLTPSVPSLPQEFVVDNPTDHGYTHNSELVFGVRWYGFPPDQNTDKPINHLPRSKVLQYCNHRGIPLFEAITQARVGYEKP